MQVVLQTDDGKPVCRWRIADNLMLDSERRDDNRRSFVAELLDTMKRFRHLDEPKQTHPAPPGVQ